jgi:dihydrofolate reductase
MTSIGNRQIKNWIAIAAMSENRVIGDGNKIPWHIPEDFKWFKKTTMGHVLIMGRKTFESIGKALPERDTIVISRNSFNHPDVKSISNFDEIDLYADQNKKVFICGGAEIYKQTIENCSELYLTIVRKKITGDAFFPSFEHHFNKGDLIKEEKDFSIFHYRNKHSL